MSNTAEGIVIPPHRRFSSTTSYETPCMLLQTPPKDVTTVDQMNIVQASGVLAFWDHPDEV